MATFHGPILEGRGPGIVQRHLPGMEQDIAQEGVNLVRARLHSVLRHPTGYYESRIVTDQSVGTTAVTDSGVVYGPWLEGVGSRNDQTRFKGYATFRRTVQDLDAQSERIAERRMPQLIRDLEG